jgi:two-component system OmpR family sensor kinase
MSARPFSGLRGRLAIGTLLVLVVAILIADMSAYWGLRQLAETRTQTNLELALTRAVLQADKLGRLDAAEIDRLSPDYVYFAFYDPDGQLLLEHLPTDVGTEPLPAMPPATSLSGEPTVVSAPGSSEGIVAISRVLPPEGQLDLTVDGMPATVGSVVAGFTNYANVDALRQFIRLQILTALALLVLAIASTYVILRIGLRPLRNVADTAHEISQGDLSRRIPVTDEHTEIGAVSTALNEAFDQAEGSEARMRTFIADASHELRTPLATIHGWADLYLHDGVQEWADVDTAMTRIRFESARMTDLVEQLLTLARMDSSAPAGTDEIDLGDLSADVVAALSVNSPDHVVQLTVVGSTAPHVIGDSAALRQIVTNLVANATRHTPSGSTVFVEIRTDDDAGAHVTLVVRDDGPGMDEAQLAQAFDRFWRADPGRGPSGGTGLGLAIVRSIALAHGGTVSLDSAPGEGLTVPGRLPRASERREHVR